MMNKIRRIFLLGVCGWCIAGGAGTVSAAELSGYQILQKTASVFSQAQSVRIVVDSWWQNPLYHFKMKMSNWITEYDNVKVEGRMSFSVLIPETKFSSSSWLQAFTLGGVPFSWSSIERLWKNEALVMADQTTQKQLPYTLVQSLFEVDEQSADVATIMMLGEEARDNKECFVVRYRLLPDSFKRWQMVSSVYKKLWVEKNTFFPVAARIEGTLGDMHVVQLVAYADFNAAQDWKTPSFILAEIADQKKYVQDAVPEIRKEVARIRGWEQVDVSNVPVVFMHRRAMHQALLDRYLRDSVGAEFQERLYQWFELIPAEASLQEIQINSEITLVAGLYDPVKKIIFVGDWLEPAAAEEVIAHEFVHAFQDAIMPLQEARSRARTLDARMASQAALEGEAFVVGFEYVLNKDNKSVMESSDIFTLLDERLVQRGYVRDKIAYTVYGLGSKFIQGFLNKKTFAELNSTYKEMPQATREILHPSDYFVRTELSKTSALPVQDRFLESLPDIAGWHQAHTTTAGELFLFLMLKSVVPKDNAFRAAQGWRDDVVSWYTAMGNEQMFVMATQWESTSDAFEFVHYVHQWLEGKGFTSTDATVYARNAKIASCTLYGSRTLVIAGDHVAAAEIAAARECIAPVFEQNKQKGA